MDGTSAREQRALHSQLTDYSTARPQTGDLNTFHSDLLSWLGQELDAFETFVVLSDPISGDLHFDGLRSTCIPAGVSSVWLKSHLERHPILIEKLSQAELVGIGADAGTPRPVEGARTSVVLVPVLHENRLLGVFGIVSWMDGPQPTAADMQTIHTCTIHAAPVLARILELERLRSDNKELNKELKELLQRLATDERTAWETARRNAQLEATAQMRTHLHSNVAHDLRTPLAAVRGYARMILDGRAGEIKERQREYLDIVVENANKMIHLVNWMSEIFDSAEQHMRLSDFDVREVWAECVKEIEKELAERSVNLTQDIPDEPFPAFADKERINRIFRQVLRSAVRFSDNGAKLVARFSHGREQEIMLKLYGITNEIPVELAMRERSPMLRGPDSDIDLSIVHDNVGVHGGRFFIRRTSEEGSVLLLTLPAIRSEVHQGSAQP